MFCAVPPSRVVFMANTGLDVFRLGRELFGPV